MSYQVMAWAECRLCAREMLVEFPYHTKGVCGRCVKDLANDYWVAHSGAPHPDFAPEAYAAHMAAKPQGYTKARIEAALKWQVFERDDFRCQVCGARQRLAADHIIPESKGGETTLENLQTLCRRCNSKKGARTE